MDWVSAAAGALAGAITGGIAGFLATYLADRQTDRRREKEKQAAARAQFEAVKREMPELIAELASDIADPKNRHVRRVFVLEHGVIMNSRSPALAYRDDRRDNLLGRFKVLENNGFIHDVTSTNIQQYALTEEFVRFLRSS